MVIFPDVPDPAIGTEHLDRLRPGIETGSRPVGVSGGGGGGDLF